MYKFDSIFAYSQNNSTQFNDLYFLINFISRMNDNRSGEKMASI